MIAISLCLIKERLSSFMDLVLVSAIWIDSSGCQVNKRLHLNAPMCHFHEKTIVEFTFLTSNNLNKLIILFSVNLHVWAFKIIFSESHNFVGHRSHFLASVSGLSVAPLPSIAEKVQEKWIVIISSYFIYKNVVSFHDYASVQPIQSLNHWKSV